MTKRRDAGSGGIERTPAGTYKVVLDAARPDTVTRKRNRYRKTFKTLREAQQAVREVLSNRDHGLNVKPEMMTTGEWLSSWLARRLREGHITGVTHARYEIAIRVHLNASVGSIGLQELRRDHVADMTGNWTTGQDGHRAQSPASVKKNLGVLRHALDDAVAADLIVRNPAAHVSAPPVPSVEEKRALTQPEIRSLLRAANATRYEVPIASLSPRGSDAGNSSLCVGPTLI